VQPRHHQLDARFDDHRHALIESAIETDRNTIVYEVARPVQHADWQRLAAAALRSPVNVVLHRVNRDDLAVTPLRYLLEPGGMRVEIASH
jgi:hypothetical protein